MTAAALPSAPWGLLAGALVLLLLTLLLACAAAFWLGGAWVRRQSVRVAAQALGAPAVLPSQPSPSYPAQAVAAARLDTAQAAVKQRHRLQSDNLRKLVQCWPEPALLLQRSVALRSPADEPGSLAASSALPGATPSSTELHGWQVLACSAATLARWPQLQVPGPLPASTEPLSPLPLPQQLDAAVLGATMNPVGGWRLAVSSLAAGDDAAVPAADSQAGLKLAEPIGLACAVLLFEAAAVRQPQAAVAPAQGSPALAGIQAASPPEADEAGNDERATSEAESFSFTVSHDLRAPVRVVEGFTRIVKEDYGPQLDRVANDHLDRVLSAAARMNHMIDALLTLARLSSQPLLRQPFDLSQNAHYVLDELRSTQPLREVNFQIEVGLTAHGDPTLLRLVLENLLGNAWKYSAKNPAALITLRSVVHEQGRAFEVRDNGAGFDMRSADRLFGLFQRLHSASEFAGHGVGLASVRRIVQRHGGQIWAESQPGQGAAFFFTLKP